MQHFTLAGSSGQKPDVEVPLPDLQSAVWRHTPETPLTEHFPLRAARAEVAVRVRRKRDDVNFVIVG